MGNNKIMYKIYFDGKEISCVEVDYKYEECDYFKNYIIYGVGEFSQRTIDEILDYEVINKVLKWRNNSCAYTFNENLIPKLKNEVISELVIHYKREIERKKKEIIKYQELVKNIEPLVIDSILDDLKEDK